MLVWLFTGDRLRQGSDVEPGTTPNQMHAGNGPRSKGVIWDIKMWVGRTASLFTLSRETTKNICALQWNVPFCCKVIWENCNSKTYLSCNAWYLSSKFWKKVYYYQKYLLNYINKHMNLIIAKGMDLEKPK